MKLIAVVTSAGEIFNNQVGFYDKVVFAEKYPDQSIVELDVEEFPEGFDGECFKVVGKKLVKKTNAAVKTILDKREEDRISASKSILYSEFLKVDVSGESDAVKLMHSVIKELHG